MLFLGFAMVVSACILAVISFLRKFRQNASNKLINIKKQKRAVGIVICLFLPVVGFSAAWFNQGAIDKFFYRNIDYGSKISAASSQGREVNAEVVAEGAVLLRNIDQTLPVVTEQYGINTEISLLGIGSVAPTYSSQLRTEISETERIDFATALREEGYEVNEALWNFQSEFVSPPESKSIYSLAGEKGSISEISVEAYGDRIEQAATTSSIAIYVISREGGEGGDLRLDVGSSGGDAGKHYLELQSDEMELLTYAQEVFPTVIVVLNCSNQLEAGFLEEMTVPAALWVGEPGDSGFTSIAKIISGKINPSGRLVDTWAYDVTDNPSFSYSGDFVYVDEEGNEAGFDENESRIFASYVDYAESIYMGYRYYETRWVDNETGLLDEEAYRKHVQFPFGYGLSYSTFSQNILATSINGQVIPEDNTTIAITPKDNVAIDVTVTNTGSNRGKEVIQLYASTPYQNGGVEKSAVVLVGFVKTSLLEPGQQEVLRLELAMEDLASYDYRVQRGYVLEAGQYQLSIGFNAHQLIDSVTFALDEEFVFDSNNPRTTDAVAATNLFDDVTYGNEVIYLSRENWEGELTRQKASPKIADEQKLAEVENPHLNFSKKQMESEEVNNKNQGSVEKDKLLLTDLQGVDSTDPLWDQYINQFSIEEMSNLFANGGWGTVEVAEWGLKSSASTDGPSGVSHYMNGDTGVGYASAMLMASSFNSDLVEKCASVLGAEANAMGYQGLYSPGVNLHRTAFSGRNFEYFSEDPFLSGKMAAAIVRGYKSSGVFPHIKHFAVNDQETNRRGVSTWLDEQALRELYLRPFEIAVKDSDAGAIMGSYNRIGTQWTAGSEALNKKVLRDEWGFDGYVITDYFDPSYMNADQALAGGIDLIESNEGHYPSQEILETDEAITSLRDATKHVSYTLVNSSSWKNQATRGWEEWPLLLIVVSLVWFGGMHIFGLKLLKDSSVRIMPAKRNGDHED